MLRFDLPVLWKGGRERPIFRPYHIFRGSEDHRRRLSKLEKIDISVTWLWGEE